MAKVISEQIKMSNEDDFGARSSPLDALHT